MHLTSAGNRLPKRSLVLQKAAKQAPILSAAAAGVKSHTMKFTRKNSVAINKMLLALAPVAGLLIAIAYIENKRGGWAAAAAVCFVVYFTLLYRDYFFETFNNEAEKYIEVNEKGLKLVEPSKNYKALIPFDEIDQVKVIKGTNGISGLDLYLKNGQRVALSGYEELYKIAELLKDTNGIKTIET
ncbi:hypothetical protein [Neptuniibacter sp. QD48_11]|uniref:hypothetical protein n=1 Tax=Neptuniibacter sp. QD48_11 TaxID=3398211 RepID=UPI0039F57846